MRNKITALLEDVGNSYSSRDVAKLVMHQGHDVHAFFRLSRNVENVVHVQGYPGMSTERKARFFARMMDYNRMMSIRKKGGVSIGNEHGAVVKIFPNFEEGVYISYEPEVLQAMIGENVSELAPIHLVNMFGPPSSQNKNIVPRDKFSLRDYLKTIDLRDARKLRENSLEIMERIRKVMAPYVAGERGDPLYDYYLPAMKKCEDAFKYRDFVRAFPEALDFMIASVDWE